MYFGASSKRCASAQLLSTRKARSRDAGPEVGVFRDVPRIPPAARKVRVTKIFDVRRAASELSAATPGLTASNRAA